MTPLQREPAFVLRRRPYGEHGLWLDVLTRAQGRRALIARGLTGRRSAWRGYLQPFQALELSSRGRSELQTLTEAEAGDATFGIGVQAVTGERFYAGCYITELLVHLLPQHDPCPGLYLEYGQTIAGLVQGAENWSRYLRHFERCLLEELGYAPQLIQTRDTDVPVERDRTYQFRIPEGAYEHPAEGPGGIHPVSGQVLWDIQQGIYDRPPYERTVRRILTQTVQYYLDGRPLESRRLLLAYRHQRGTTPRGESPSPPAETAPPAG